VREVVVVGAGHNALIAACYLARAGLDVEMVERRDRVGGAVSTVERFGGHRMDEGSSAHIMIRHTGIAEDLDLAACGLAYHDLDPWGFAPFGDEALVFSRDLTATCDSIAAVCGDRDATAYEAFVTDWAARNERVFAAFQAPPTVGNLGRRSMGLGRRTGLGGLELSRQFLTSGDALLDEHFEDERLKTALAWMGAQSGPAPHEPATADLVGWNALLHRISPGVPVGGSGMLSIALARRLEALGGTLRLGDGATRITTADGRTTGIETASGDRVRSAEVLAGCHVLTTLGLVDDPRPSWQDAAARARRRVRTGNGIGMVARLATDSLPDYTASAGGDEHRALQLLAPSRRAMREAHGAFTAGHTPDAPPVLAMTFSAFDDSLAPPGRHTVSLWGQWHPYALADGQPWGSRREQEAHKLVEAVDAVAPGFAGKVRQMHVQSPADFESELGLVNGQVMHVEMSLDQLFAWRPTPELSGYRTPLAGLYLTGASTHPGGGVFGASGRSAARVLLADRAGRRRRLVPRRLARGG
jgi:phytoene dehydrogenase-like protein